MGKVTASRYTLSSFQNLIKRLRDNDPAITELDFSNLTIDDKSLSLEQLTEIRLALQHNPHVHQISLPANLKFSFDEALNRVKVNESDKKQLDEQFGPALAEIMSTQELQEKQNSIEAQIKNLNAILSVYKIKDLKGKLRGIRQNARDTNDDVVGLIENAERNIRNEIRSLPVNFFELYLDNFKDEMNLIIKSYDPSTPGNATIRDRLTELKEALLSDFENTYYKKTNMYSQSNIKKLQSEQEVTSMQKQVEILKRQADFIKKVTEKTFGFEIEKINKTTEHNQSGALSKKREENAEIFDNEINKLVGLLKMMEEKRLAASKPQARSSILPSFSNFKNTDITNEIAITLAIIQDLTQCYNEKYEKEDLLKLEDGSRIQQLAKNQERDFNADKLAHALDNIKTKLQDKDLREPLATLLKDTRDNLRKLLDKSPRESVKDPTIVKGPKL